MSFVVMGRFIKGCTDAGLALVVLSHVVQVQLKLRICNMHAIGQHTF